MDLESLNNRSARTGTNLSWRLSAKHVIELAIISQICSRVGDYQPNMQLSWRLSAKHAIELAIISQTCY